MFLFNYPRDFIESHKLDYLTLLLITYIVEDICNCTLMIKPNFKLVWEFIVGVCKMELCKQL